MVEIYLSKNKTAYYFNGEGHLTRNKGGKKKDWGKAIYVSNRTLQDLVKKWQIPIGRKFSRNNNFAEGFVKELEEESMNLKEKGGRFVSLIREEDELLQEEDEYFLRYSSKIVEKFKRENLNEDTEIPIDENDKNN